MRVKSRAARAPNKLMEASIPYSLWCSNGQLSSLWRWRLSYDIVVTSMGLWKLSVAIRRRRGRTARAVAILESIVRQASHAGVEV